MNGCLDEWARVWLSDWEGESGFVKLLNALRSECVVEWVSVAEYMSWYVSLSV